MKIAVISSTVFSLPVNGYAGLEHLACQIAVGLAAKGHQVAVMAPDGSQVPGCSVVPFGPVGRINEQTAYGVYWKLLPNFDVVIDHSWLKSSYLLKGEGRLPAPVLAVMHAPVATMYQSLPPNVPKPCFVCISKDQAAHFEALFSRSARVAYNGVDGNWYRSTGARRTDRYLFLARLSTIKGPDLAIEACKRAGVGLDVVGDLTITGEPEFAAKIKAMCDGEQIRLIGNQT